MRLSKRSGAIIPLPEEAKQKGSLTKTAGPKDTPAEVAAKVTYTPPAELLPYLSRESDLFRIRCVLPADVTRKKVLR